MLIISKLSPKHCCFLHLVHLVKKTRNKAKKTVGMSSCPTYSSSNGLSVTCGPVYICPGTSITVDSCGSCTGDQILALTTTSGTTQVSNDDGCGTGSLCSRFTYGVPATQTKCLNYDIKEYCSGSTTCGGTVSYSMFPSATPYTQYIHDSFCSGNAVQGGISSPGSCSQIGETEKYVSVICEGTTTDSDWTVKVFTSDTCSATSTVLDQVSGSGQCACASLDLAGLSGYAVQVNCAGQPSRCGGGSSNSNNNDAAIIGGSVAGGVVFIALLVVAGLFLAGVWTCRGKAPMATSADNDRTPHSA